MLSPKAGKMQAPFLIRLAQICDEKNLILLPQKQTAWRRRHLRKFHNCSNQVIQDRFDKKYSIMRARTDPSSCWVFPKERTIFDKKCGDWGIDPEHIEEISWNWRRTYETWMRIQTNYSLFDHRSTIRQGRFPFYSSLKPGLVFQGARFRV